MKATATSEARHGGASHRPDQLEADGYGCDWHPSLITHQKVAETLKAALKQALNW